jgi:phosphatidylinositol-3-phosphatase
MFTGIRSVSLPRLVSRTALLLLGALAWAPQVHAQLPKAGHVVVVVEENRDYSDVFHTTMPYLDSLAAQYGYASNYYANTHPGIGDAMMMTTGTLAATSNTYSGTVSSDNLVRQLLVLGKTWKSYAENLPSVGYTGGDVPYYVKYRNAFAYFTDVANSTNQKTGLVPFTQFATDLKNGTLPNLSWVLPNTSNDANIGTRAAADLWLKNNIGPLLANATFKADGVLIILFDQARTDNTNGGGKVYAVVVSPAFSKTAYVSSTTYQHQSLLRTVLGLLGGTTFPGSAATAPAMSEFFKATSSPTPAPTATISANPTSITQGGSTTLTWSSTNATSATLNGSAVATSGSQTVSPSSTTTYTLSVTGAGGTASSNVPITVTSSSGTTTHSATLNWTDPNASGVTSYKVYRAAGTLDSTGASVASCGTLAAIATVTAPTKTYADSAVTAGAGYCYAITALNSTSESAKSGTVKAVIPGGSTTPPPPASSTSVALLQHVTSEVSSGVTSATQSITGVTAGSLLVVCNRLGSTALAPTISDSTSNPLRDLFNIPNTTGGHTLFCRYIENASAGTHTFTFTAANAASFRILIDEFSNIVPSGSLDRTNSVVASSSTCNSGNTAITSQAHELFLGFGTYAPTAATWTVGPGYSLVDRVGTGGASLAAEWKEVNAAQAANATFTLSASNSSICAVAAFKGK